MSDTGRPVKPHRSGGGAPAHTPTGPEYSPQVFSAAVANDCKASFVSAGRKAYDSGLPANACPYPAGTDEARWWREGWLDSYEEDAE